MYLLGMEVGVGWDVRGGGGGALTVPPWVRPEQVKCDGIGSFCVENELTINPEY